MRSLLLLPLALLGAAPFRSPEVVVEFKTFQVAPDTLRVPVGATVRWVNRDQVEHTVTGGTPERRVPGWDAVLTTQGKTTTRTFDRAGTWGYFCDRHQFMRGTVIVTPTR